MSSWKSAILRLWPFRSENKETSPVKTDTKKLNRVLGPWEAYMVTLQSILIWERPGSSAVAVVAVNVLFWLLVWSDLRLYFVLSVCGLCVFLHQQWVHSIWPEIRVSRPELEDTEEWTPVHPSVLSVPEISQYVEGVWRCLKDNYTWLLHLRRVQPALFCAIVSTVLSVGAVVGHLVPGVVLVYIILMLVMTGPGIILHVLPDSFFQRIAKIRAALRGEDSQMDTSNISMDSDITEFLPELRSAEAQAALDVPLMSQDPPEVEQMVEDAYLQEGMPSGTTRRRARKGGKNGEEGSTASQGLSLPLYNADGTTYFASGLPEDFPSYDHESVEDLDGVDVELPEVSKVVPDPTKERQGVDHYQMKFVSSHFGDSSEDDDDFTEGLTFEERSQIRPEICQPQPALLGSGVPAEVNPLGQLMSSMIAQNAGNVLSALGQNLVTSVIGQSVQAEMLSSSMHQQPRPEQQSQPPAPPPARMTRSYDQQQQSVTDVEEDFELISDEEFQ